MILCSGGRCGERSAKSIHMMSQLCIFWCTQKEHKGRASREECSDKMQDLLGCAWILWETEVFLIYSVEGLG